MVDRKNLQIILKNRLLKFECLYFKIHYLIEQLEALEEEASEIIDSKDLSSIRLIRIQEERQIFYKELEIIIGITSRTSFEIIY